VVSRKVGGLSVLVAAGALTGIGYVAAAADLPLDGPGPDAVAPALTAAEREPARPLPTPTATAPAPVLRPEPLLAPGDTGPRVRRLQARLQQIEWYFGEITPSYDAKTTEAVTGFQAKRGLPTTGEVDRRTWRRLVAMTETPTAREMHNLPPTASEGAPLDPRCLHGEALCLDKTSNSLRYVVDGAVRMQFAVRFGEEDETPTREGAFEVLYKDEDHVSTMFHTKMPYSMFFSGGQAVHYSHDFKVYGYAGASHGCVNVRDWQEIQDLYDRVEVGDKVIVYWS
jgi:Putative peptidoglycan binding domain/L,D-transpeptidase catalytic domain